jgi:3-O-methylgallate 3,4-dioxygenase
MAQIVLGIGTSHSPMLSTPPEMWHLMGQADQRNPFLVNPTTGEPATYAELLAARASQPVRVDEAHLHRQWAACQTAIDSLARTIESVKPDVLVVVSADQGELLHDDNMPSLMVYWGESIPLIVRQLPEDSAMERVAGNWGYGDVEMDLPVESNLGAHIIDCLVNREFDVAHSRYVKSDNVYSGEIGPAGYMRSKHVSVPRRQGIGHGWSFVVRRLLGNRPIPMVPIFQNATFPPNMPTPTRALATGTALKAAIESWDADKRVCIVASGGLSHFVTDEPLDRMVIAGILAGDLIGLSRIPRARLDSASGEIRCWMTVAAACADLTPEMVDYVPVYRSAAGTGGGWGFSRWQ